MVNSKEQIGVWVLTILVVLLIFWSPSWSLSWLRDYFWTAPSYNEPALLAENQVLKAEVAALAEVKRLLDLSGTAGGLPVVVLSRYPLNFKNRILIAAGANAGVAAGQAVILPERILIGRVINVFSNTSLVQTVFDPGFQAAVRVGGAGVEALLTGGGEPKLTFVPRDAELKSGDIVYTADPAFPYGLPVAEVGEIHLPEGELFREATLKFAYGINGLRAALLMPKQ